MPNGGRVLAGIVVALNVKIMRRQSG